MIDILFNYPHMLTQSSGSGIDAIGVSVDDDKIVLSQSDHMILVDPKSVPELIELLEGMVKFIEQRD